MPHASHRISVFLVSRDPERGLSEGQEAELFEEFGRLGWLSQGGRAGAEAEEVMDGGFHRMRIDRPKQSVLYGNRLGGFRATCPACGASVAAGLGGVIKRWRETSNRVSACDACGHESRLEDWVYAPQAAPGKWAIVFTRAGSPSLREEAREKVQNLVGSVVEVVSRG